MSRRRRTAHTSSPDAGARTAPILGIDVGASGIKGGPVDVSTGRLLAPRVRHPTPRRSTPGCVAAVVSQIARDFEWTGPIGCCLPAVVRNGRVLTAANIDDDWIGCDGQSLFEHATGCAVTVINDADAAGIAEMAFGAGRGRTGVVLLVTLGTGIGTALFTGGILAPNTEMGHIELQGRDAERYAADSVRKRRDMTWKRWARRVDRYLCAVRCLLWPELIIIGGGACRHHGRFLPRLTVEADVVPAQLGNDAGIVGAALAAAARRERVGHVSPRKQSRPPMGQDAAASISVSSPASAT